MRNAKAINRYRTPSPARGRPSFVAFHASVGVGGGGTTLGVLRYAIYSNDDHGNNFKSQREIELGR